ncbi:MAG: hypothetical protein Q4F31_09315 [Eubacteriales bacterium]|nr:hypothetical protein [Eubacteriales bacterium]
MPTNELTERVHELRELKRMVEELNTEIETIQDCLKDYMTLKGTDELSGPDFKITWKEVVSRRFDSKNFKAQHSDLYDLFTVATPTRRFSLM